MLFIASANPHENLAKETRTEFETRTFSNFEDSGVQLASEYIEHRTCY